MTNKEIVQTYIPIAKFIAAICGPRYEVALHCLDDLDHSIVAIENGYISGRKVGDGLRNYALETIFNDEYVKGDFIANVRGKSINNRHMKYSNLFIKDHNGNIIGFLAVNADITELEQILEFANTELSFHSGLDGIVHFPMTASAAQMIDTVISEIVHQMGHNDVLKLKKEEKLHVISALNAQSLFLTKGSVSIVAKHLGISEPTVYRYLKEVKKESLQIKSQAPNRT